MSQYIWVAAFLLLPIIGISYVFWHLWHLLPLPAAYKYIVLGVLTLGIFTFFANFGLFHLDNWPMPLATAVYQVGTASLFVLLYSVLLFLVLDFGKLIHLVPRNLMFHSWAGTLALLGILVLTFTYGYFHYMDKKRVPIAMHTLKSLSKPMKIVMLSDLHIGYNNQVGELDRWVDMVNRENPDLILIGGDIIDGHFRPLEEQNMAGSFRRLHAPVVGCLGNHEFYSGLDNALRFYKEAGITLLRDSAMTLNGINLVGRDDRTNHKRKPLGELIQGLDKSKYTILLDHQPFHLEEVEKAGIDFQFSGHTHDGQLWPINWITRAIYEQSFGPLQKGKTQYYVSSGMGLWGGKFRIGTRSEYIVGTLVNP